MQLKRFSKAWWRTSGRGYASVGGDACLNQPYRKHKYIILEPFPKPDCGRIRRLKTRVFLSQQRVSGLILVP